MIESETRETAIKTPEGPRRVEATQGQILPQRVAPTSLDVVGGNDNIIDATETGKFRVTLSPKVAPTQSRIKTEGAEEAEPVGTEVANQANQGQTQPQQVAPAPLHPNSDAAKEHEAKVAQLMKMGFEMSDVLAVLAADEGGDLENAVACLLDH